MGPPVSHLRGCIIAPLNLLAPEGQLPANVCALLLRSSSSKRVWETRIDPLDEWGRVGKAGLPITLDYLCPPYQPHPIVLDNGEADWFEQHLPSSIPEDQPESLASTDLGFTSWAATFEGWSIATQWFSWLPLLLSESDEKEKFGSDRIVPYKLEKISLAFCYFSSSALLVSPDAS